MSEDASRLNVLMHDAAIAVHVGWSFLSPEHDSMRADLKILDRDELFCAESFAVTSDRRRYVTSHALLRRELGACLGADPAKLQLGRRPCVTCGSPHGQPFVKSPPTDVEFSISRSRTAVGVAISTTGPVGFDLEETVGKADLAALLELLHNNEMSELSDLEPASLPTEFTRLWTRKEAYLKALGTGLGRAPDMDYLGKVRAEDRPTGWTVENLRLEAGLEAAVATRPLI